MADVVKIFDTTLRDGEQAPGYSMNIEEKVRMARQLERLGVDVIEAGFAIASPGDFASVQAVARELKDTCVCSLSRALEKDIDASAEALGDAVNPRIHTFIATSDIHMKYKLKATPDEVYERAVKMTAYARNLCGEVEFSAEDAARSDLDFLCRVFEGVIDAGAGYINIPDTVGYTTPDEFYRMVTYIREHTPNIDKAVISVHCHNDLGLAVANTLAAIRAGALQAECTVNGIGERAGNAALEELVMTLATRRDYYHVDTSINTREIHRSSKLLSNITGVSVQPNKAIVGANAFAHEAGIHQHGILSHSSTYEIMTPESIGLHENRMVLGKHSGHHAFSERIKSLGYQVDDQILAEMFVQFKNLADKKKVVEDKDLEALMESKASSVPETFSLNRFVINSGNTISSTASLRILKGDEQIEDVATGDGPVDASFMAIERIVGVSFSLDEYVIHAVTGGKDAQGEVSVKIELEGKVYKGRGVSTDVVEASILAYLAAVNRYFYEES